MATDIPSLLSNFSTNRSHVNQIIDYCNQSINQSKDGPSINQSINRTEKYLEDCLCSIAELIGQCTQSIDGLIDVSINDLQSANQSVNLLSTRLASTEEKIASIYQMTSLAANVQLIDRNKPMVPVPEADLPPQNRAKPTNQSRQLLNQSINLDSLSTLGMENRGNRFKPGSISQPNHAMTPSIQPKLVDQPIHNLANQPSAGFATPPLMGTMRQSLNNQAINQAINQSILNNQSVDSSTSQSVTPPFSQSSSSNRTSMSGIPMPPPVDQSFSQSSNQSSRSNRTSMSGSPMPPPVDIQQANQSAKSNRSSLSGIPMPPPIDQSSSQSSNSPPAAPMFTPMPMAAFSQSINQSNDVSVTPPPVTPPSTTQTISRSTPPPPPMMADSINQSANSSDDATHVRRISLPPPLPVNQSANQSTNLSVSQADEPGHVRRVSVPPPLPANQSSPPRPSMSTPPPPPVVQSVVPPPISQSINPPPVSQSISQSPPVNQPINQPPPVTQSTNQATDTPPKLTGVAALRSRFGTMNASTSQSINPPSQPGSVGRASFTINPKHSVNQSIDASANVSTGRKSVGPPPVPVGRTSIGPPPVPRASIGESINQSVNQSSPPQPPMMDSVPPPPPMTSSAAPPPPPVTSSAAPPPPGPPSISSTAPPPPGPPSAPSISAGVKKPLNLKPNQPVDRNALLGGIQGFKGGLRKVQTVDKSAPLVEGKAAPPAAASSNSSTSSSTPPNPMAGRSSMSMQDEMAARLARMRAKNP